MIQHGKVAAVVGAQFGSEGKGAIVAEIAANFQVHVRTGAPNAGHTYYGLHGEKLVARSLPVAAGATEGTMLILGPGAFIDYQLLIEEIKQLEALGYDLTDRVFVDAGASLVDPIRHHQFEGGVDGAAHRQIGSTGEGVGPAVMARVARRTFPADVAWAKMDLVAQHYSVAALENAGVLITDTALLVNEQIDEGRAVLLEGTQGSGLSLVHGPWPYVTSRDTNAAALCMDAGIAPSLLTDTFLVARSFPIRVAGNSGPLPLETTWEEIGQQPEQTTVTKKTRRVGRFHPETVLRSIMLNRPDGIFLTFLDYLCPQDAGVTEWEQLSAEAKQAVVLLEGELAASVLAVGTGPRSVAWNPSPWRSRPMARFIGEPDPLLNHDWPTHDAAYGETEPATW